MMGLPRQVFEIQPDPNMPGQGIVGWHVIPEYPGGFDYVLRALEADDIVIFAGAGVSMANPSNAPGWLSLAQEIIGAGLAEAERRKLLPRRLAQRLSSQVASTDLLPEEVMAHVSACLKYQGPDDATLEIRQLLSSPLAAGQCNGVHLTFAAALAASHVKAIITTNFDRYFEDALALLGAAHVPVVWDRDGLPGDDKELPPLLLKLHGTLADERSIQTTVYQTGSPLSDWRSDLLARLVDGRHVLFVGYSGNDLDVAPCLHSALASSREFTWVVRESKGSAVSDNVICRYPEKGHGACGDLFALVRCFSDMAVQRLDDRASRLISEAWAQTGLPSQPTYDSTKHWMERLSESALAAFVANTVAAFGSPPSANEVLAKLGARLPMKALGNLHNRVSACHLEAARIEDAIAHAQSAVTIGKETANHRILGDAYNNMGLAHKEQARVLDALSWFELSVKERKADRDPWREAVTRMNIALVLLLEGDADRARDIYLDCLPTLVAAGDQQNVGAVLANVGQCLLRTRNIPKALKYLSAALLYFEIRKDLAKTYTAVLRIAACYKILGNRPKFDDAMSQADSLVEQLPDRVREPHAAFHRAVRELEFAAT